jgi:hypothetical protein
MATPFRNIEKVKEELTHLHGELLQLEERLSRLRESLSKAIAELFGSNRQAFPALQEAAWATRIAEAVVSRLPPPSLDPSSRKRYVREKEAAEYIEVKVSTLRAWRLHRSKAGPPFNRVGRMVMYSVAELEEHMRAGLVPRRG